MKKMLTVILVWAMIVVSYPYESRACTTFSIAKNGHWFVGKNYDWHLERGLIIINKRGVSKKAMEDKKNDPGPFARWTSKYGSLTFNQYGRDLPSGGINEAGLVVEQMMLTSTKHPPRDKRPAINETQWIQYQLDNFSRVDQVLSSDSYLRIHASSGLGIHYLVADKEGNCATIEFVDGKRIYHTRKTLPFKLLTNNTYAESMAYLKQHKGFGGQQEIRFSSQSLGRFVRSAAMLKQYGAGTQSSALDYAFEILEEVSQSSSAWGTKWRIVYDIQNRRVYFRTFSNKQIRYVDLRGFDFSCQTPIKVLDLEEPGSGDVTPDFKNYTQKLNLDLIRYSFKKTRFLAGVPDKDLEALSKYPEKARCE